MEEEAKERDIATKAKEKQAKKVQAEVTALHGTIGKKVGKKRRRLQTGQRYAAAAEKGKGGIGR